MPEILYPKQSKNALMLSLVTQTKLMDIPYIQSSSLSVSESALSEAQHILTDGNYSLIIDAIFGFSFQPPVRDPFGAILAALSSNKIPIFSIDIPSGDCCLFLTSIVVYKYYL